MALINCTDCDKEISENALSCINCGAPVPRRSFSSLSNAKYRNPHTGIVDSIGSPALGSLFFGCFYFLIRKMYYHAVISLVLAVITGGLSWFVFPFFAAGIVDQHYLKNGWIRIQ
jgi:hypothetical protein